ncbi:MAG: NUDIX domain-containing protein [Candidatus Paceibacterota bacterium]
MIPPKIAAGLLMYRIRDSKREVFLVHPGGPFWKNKDFGYWSIPKGETHDGEGLLVTAVREFEEETNFKSTEPFFPLGSAKYPNKIVHAWAFQGDFDPANLVSNTCEIDWPPHSGKRMTIPEVDRGEYFTIEQAKQKIYPYQMPILEAFEKLA